MNDAAFRDRLGDLPRYALSRGVGDVQPLFASASCAACGGPLGQRIPWVSGSPGSGRFARLAERSPSRATGSGPKGRS